MTKCFYWIIDANAEKLVSSKRGVSPSYILPTLGTCDPRNIAGAILFVVLRGSKGDVLLKKLYISKVEEFFDDETESCMGFLLSADLLRSIRTVSNYTEGIENFNIALSESFSLGISECDVKSANQLIDRILSHTAIRFKEPTEQDLAAIASNIQPELRTESIAIQILKQLSKNYPLSSIWGSRSYVNPYSNFAINYLKKFQRQDEKDVIDIIKNYSGHFFGMEGENILSKSSPVVDIDFEPIDVSRISSRKFVAIDKTIDLNISMQKTEDAEKRHQDILKDLCVYFMDNGLTPEQSNSIDLALRTKEQFAIFEIKTSTPDNITTQAAKGVFQLASYAVAIAKTGLNPPRKILILESSGNSDLDKFVCSTVAVLGVEPVIYTECPWPDRLEPKFELIS